MFAPDNPNTLPTPARPHVEHIGNHEVRFGIDGKPDAWKYKIDHGMWSLPFRDYLSALNAAHAELQPAQYKFVVYDSDGNEVETIRGTAGLAHAIGEAVLRHYALVDDTTLLNRSIGVPDADESYLTIVRELAID